MQLDVFAVHGVGGIVGNLLTGVLTQRYWPSLDGTSILYSGVIEGEGLLLAWQIVDCLASFSWSFGVTSVILLLLNRIPGLSLRLDEDNEELGIDMSEMGEVAFDYIHELNATRKEKSDLLKRTESQEHLKEINNAD
eukprot:NODE_195_length_15388_cov_0.563926.p6 type:complete len:137 gc:universal NODE_195_length_15388_cov_0.563926:11139-11549(+)